MTSENNNKVLKNDTSVHCWFLRVKLFKKYEELSKNTYPSNSQEMQKQKFVLLTYNDEFVENVLKIRKDYYISKNGFLSVRDSLVWLENSYKTFLEKNKEVKLKFLLDNFKKELENLMNSFEIKYRWFDCIEYYIFYNKIPPYELFPKKVKIIPISDGFGEPALSLEIYPNTTLEDLRNEWRTIKTFLGIIKSQEGLNVNDSLNVFFEKLDKIDPVPIINKQNKKINREAKEFNKLKRAYDLKQTKTANEVANLLKEEGFCKKCVYYQATGFINDFKKKIKSNVLD